MYYIVGHCDGKEIQADSTEARIDASSTGGGPGGRVKHGGGLGEGRAADPGPCRTCHEALARKKRERRKLMAMEKTKTPGVYKIVGRKGKVKYRLYVNVKVPDPLSAAGFKWKLKGTTHDTYQNGVDAK